MFGKPFGEDFARLRARPSHRRKMRKTGQRTPTTLSLLDRRPSGIKGLLAVGTVFALIGGLTLSDAGAAFAAQTENLASAQPSESVQNNPEVSPLPIESSETPLDESAETETSPAPEPSAEIHPSEDSQTTPAPSPKRIGPDTTGLTAEPMSVGPDGATAPFTHWNVLDESGTPVPGATFTFESYVNSRWTGTRNVSDCASGSCSGVDRDTDGGEFLAKWIGSNTPGANPSGTTVVAGNRYRVLPVNPPAGYAWVSDISAVDSNTRTWTGEGANQSLDFGSFTVRKVTYIPMCQSGYVYGLDAAGQMQEVSPNGTVKKIGSTFGLANAPSANGLGIGTGGSPVFAYQRTDSGENSVSVASIYQYDVNTGTWSNTGASVNSTSGNRTVQFVAGAVNLQSGRYFLGGYSGSGTNRVFRIWEYNPATKSIVYKGYINTPTAAGVNANGDMAFDANGNLFVVRGSGNTTTIYSVTAANLSAANGSLISSSGSNSVSNTTSDVNGVAFDADGKGYLGSSSEVQRYDMPGWTSRESATGSLSGSTDLASCGSPPTIVLEKYVEGGRVEASDQFTLTLRQGGPTGTVIGSATTTGNKNELQGERVGPLPTVRGVALNFAETGTAGTSLGEYATSYRCLVDGEQTVQGNGTSGSIVIPANGQAVECRFYNSPLIAEVNVHKQVTDSQGKNPQPAQGWTVGASAQATTGTITSNPTAPTQSTNADGTASWRLAFGASNNKANLSVHELMQDGYKFDSGLCRVAGLDGVEKTTTLNGATDNPTVGIVPGDKVDCTFVNALKPATVSINKSMLDFNGQDPKPAAGWLVGATLDSGSSTGVSISTPATAQTEANGRVGTPWVVHYPTKPGATAKVLVQETMQDGYEFVSGLCIITSDNGDETQQVINSTSQVLTGLAPGDEANCTFTNKPKTGSVLWEKVDAAEVALKDSQWLLSGPSNFNQGEPLAVTDCVAGTAAQCTGPDRNPEAGKFELADLPWGNYQLKETKAPAGYVLSDVTHKFVIGNQKPAQLNWVLGPIVNEQQPGLNIPLTGGTGTQTYLLGGGAALLAALGIIGWRRKKGASRDMSLSSND